MDDDQTIADKVLASPSVACGEPFRSAQLASYIGENRDSVRRALNDLRMRGVVTMHGDGRWSIVRRHWIHRQRLANPVHDPRRDVA